jgi:hypothetical protein
MLAMLATDLSAVSLYADGGRQSLRGTSARQQSGDSGTAGAAANYLRLKQRPFAGMASAPDSGSPDSGGVAGDPDICTTPGNCQDRNNDDADTSDRITFVTAEGFSPAADGDITDVCFWGAYDDGTQDCQGLAPDTFEINYYANDAGLPGALIASFSQAGGTLTLTGPVATGEFIAGFAPEYAYTAVHAPVPVTAGGCYWIEISNFVNSPACSWFWERGFGGDSRGAQDGLPLDGYGIEDTTVLDHAFCLNVPVTATTACYPGVPVNDDCANSLTLSEGLSYFDTTQATTDGLAEPDCAFGFEEDQVNQDIWYDYTATCDGELRVSLCTSQFDTKLVLYDGLGCPIEPGPLVCNDDACGPDQLQSTISLDVLTGEAFKIRVGGFSTEVFPGLDVGPGTINIQCGTACTPDAGNCFEPNGTPGCEDAECCGLVCAQDAFCCDTEWDQLCAHAATALCLGAGEVCAMATGDCCVEQPTPGCEDIACCVSVCECDGFCCQVEWDTNCAGEGLGGNGCGAAALCGELCTPCKDGDVTWFDPIDGSIDAGQPTLITNPLVLQGVDTFTVVGPADSEAECWTMCETVQNAALHPIGSGNNIITNVDTVGGGLYTLTLFHPITPGEVTRITYTSSSGNTIETASFTAHPGDVNGDGTGNGDDIVSMTLALDGVTPLPLLQTDTDRNEVAGPEDLLRLVDILNGGGDLLSWFGVVVDQNAQCP